MGYFFVVIPVIRTVRLHGVFMNETQKRVLRPVLIDGLDQAEFILRNADPIWLHQIGLRELMPDFSLDERDATGADADDIPF